MIFSLAQDFTDTLAAMPREHPHRRILVLLDEAIRRDVHFIDRHPTTLFEYLWNSCWWYDCPEAAEYYDPPDEGWPAAGPPWARPGLCALLQRWRTEKEQRTPGFCWVRSLRSTAHSLGGAQRFLVEGLCSCLALSPDGRLLVGRTADELVVWNARCQPLARLRGQQGCLDAEEGDRRWRVRVKGERLWFETYGWLAWLGRLWGRGRIHRDRQRAPYRHPQTCVRRRCPGLAVRCWAGGRRCCTQASYLRHRVGPGRGRTGTGWCCWRSRVARRMSVAISQPDSSRKPENQTQPIGVSDRPSDLCKVVKCSVAIVG